MAQQTMQSAQLVVDTNHHQQWIDADDVNTRSQFHWFLITIGGSI